MKIEKGQKYLCASEVIMDKDPKRCAYTQGQIYTSEADGRITDNFDNKDHWWDISAEFNKSFKPLSSAKWAIKRTPENAEVVNKWANEKIKYSKNILPYAGEDQYFHYPSLQLDLHQDYKHLFYSLRDGYTEIDFETFKEITGIGEEKEIKEAVHCYNIEQCEKVLEILNQNKPSLWFRKEHLVEAKDMCFEIKPGFSYAKITFYQSEGYTIIPAEQFIKDNEKKIFTIEDVRNGKCAIENDGKEQNIKTLVKYIFGSTPLGSDKFYFKHGLGFGWDSSSETDLPTQSVKLFLSQIESEKEQHTEEWQPKWGEVVEVTLLNKLQNVIYISKHPKKSNRHVVSLGNEIFTVRDKNLRQLSIHTFTTEQAKQDLAKLHNLNVNQIKITE